MAQQKRKWTRGEKLTAYGLLLALVAIIAAFFVPEVRIKLGLEKPASKTVSAEVSTPTATPTFPPAAQPEATPQVPPKRKKHGKASAGTDTGDAKAGTITQGPGSIVQIGGTGNTATIYNALPEAKLTARYDAQTVSEPNGTSSYKIIVTINTDRPAQSPQFTIVCDAPCAYVSMDLGIYALMGSNRQVNDQTVEVGLSQSLSPNQTLTVVLQGKLPFRIASIQKM